MKKKKQSPQSVVPPQPKPREILGNNRHDLAANQQGVLSPNQAAKLQQTVAHYRRWTLRIGCYLPLIMAIILLFVGPSLDPMLIVLLAAVPLSLPTGLRWLATVADIQSGKVQMLEGTAMFQPPPRSRGVDLEKPTFSIGGKRFKFPKGAFAKIQAGAVYRVYYTPNLKHVVALEYLMMPDKKKQIISGSFDHLV